MLWTAVQFQQLTFYRSFYSLTASYTRNHRHSIEPLTSNYNNVTMKNQHGPNMLAEAACEVNYNPRSVTSVSCSHCFARAAGTGSLMCCVCAIWVHMYWLSIHQLAQESLGHRGHNTWQYFTDTESFDWLNSGSADGLLQRRLPRCKKSFLHRASTTLVYKSYPPARVEWQCMFDWIVLVLARCSCTR